jgi:hypothetical protein
MACNVAPTGAKTTVSHIHSKAAARIAGRLAMEMKARSACCKVLSPDMDDRFETGFFQLL